MRNRTEAQMRQEAAKYTKEFLSEFQAYLNFFNTLNGLDYTLHDALNDDFLVQSYQIASNNISIWKNAKQKPRAIKTTKTVSTKRLSFDAFKTENADSVQNLIYNALKKSDSQAMTRTVLAKQLSLRLSTVCGAVKPLIEEGRVMVDGYVIDSDSNRRVETLIAL